MEEQLGDILRRALAAKIAGDEEKAGDQLEFAVLRVGDLIERGVKALEDIAEYKRLENHS